MCFKKVFRFLKSLDCDLEIRFTNKKKLKNETGMNLHVEKKDTE